MLIYSTGSSIFHYLHYVSLTLRAWLELHPFNNDVDIVVFDLARDWKSMRSYALVAYCNEWTNGAGHVPLLV